MASDLSTTQQLMLTMAAKEGGWTAAALNHNQPLNNPFGVNTIKNGRAAGNKSYPTLGAAIQDWENKFGGTGSGDYDSYGLCERIALSEAGTGSTVQHEESQLRTTIYSGVRSSWQVHEPLWGWGLKDAEAIYFFQLFAVVFSNSEQSGVPDKSFSALHEPAAEVRGRI
jgi:hypothetical protein